MASRYICQQCGRPAFFQPTNRNRKATGNAEHDLCQRCWAKLMTAVRAAEAAEEEETLP